MNDMQEPPLGHPALDEVPHDDAGIPIAVNWRAVLEYAGKFPLNNLDNAVRAIAHDPALKGRIWYDEFLDSIITNWHGPARKWIDPDDVQLQLHLQRHVGLTRISPSTCHDAAVVAAFHDVRNECKTYITGCKARWDGTARLEFLMSEAFGADDNVYTRAVGRCWFISMVARVLQPGCKVDTVPVLEGKQGKGKSSALSTIGGKWFTECHENVLNKDFFGVLEGNMLVEIAEMHSFSRSEVERVKGLISCRMDRYRKAYGRNTQDHPRQSVLACTTNRDDWQKDDTGARRFWPILCGDINLEWLRINRDNLFGEAVTLYENGIPWWDVPEEDQKREAELRRDADSWEQVIEHWLIGQSGFNTTDILLNCLKIEISKHERSLQTRVVRIMKLLGYQIIVTKDLDRKSKRIWRKRVDTVDTVDK